MDLRGVKPSKNFMDRTGDGYADHMKALMRVFYDAQTGGDRKWVLNRMEALEQVARDEELEKFLAYQYFQGGPVLHTDFNPEVAKRRMVQRRFGTAR
jgi:hypothetical protein